MAGTGQIRAKEARVQLTVDGVRLGGSFVTIHDVSIKPDAQIAKKRFTGQKRASGDLDVQGFDISFKSEKSDHIWQELWDLIMDAERNSRPLPDITLTISVGYRDGSGITKSTGYSGDMVLKMDEDSIPKDGYQVNSWTGFCSDSTASQS